MRFPGIDQTVALNYEDGGWATAGLLTNPGVGAVYADTGQLAVGIYDFELYLSTSALMAAAVEHRNAANTATLKYHYLFVPGNWTGRMVIRSYKLAANERLRVWRSTAFVGMVQASIIYVQRIG